MAMKLGSPVAFYYYMAVPILLPQAAMHVHIAMGELRQYARTEATFHCISFFEAILLLTLGLGVFVTQSGI